MRYLATILITLLLATPAMSVELFRYRGAAMDDGTLEYILRGLACASFGEKDLSAIPNIF